MSYTHIYIYIYIYIRYIYIRIYIYNILCAYSLKHSYTRTIYLTHGFPYNILLFMLNYSSYY